MLGSIPRVALWFGKPLQPSTLLYVTSSVTKLRWNWPAAVVALEASRPREWKSNPQTKSIHIQKYQMEDVRLVAGGQLVTFKVPLPSNSQFFFLYHTQTSFLIEFSLLKKYQACCVESVSAPFFFVLAVCICSCFRIVREGFFLNSCGSLCMLNNARIDNL